MAQYNAPLQTQLNANLIAFGEWCAAKHSLEYHSLPDWFLLFDIYDRSANMFWSVAKRNEFAKETGLTTVQQILKGKYSIEELTEYVCNQSSQYRNGKLEGIVIRKDNEHINLSRGKLVNPSFIQAIETHWRSRTIEWNRVA